MTDKHDKLVEMALKSGAVNHFVQGLPDRYAFSLNELTAFAAAHVASLCADVEPVPGAVVRGEVVYSTSTVASLTAQRDAALARVAELEKDAEPDEFTRGIDAAAKMLDKMADDYSNAHAWTDPDTGVSELTGAKEEHYNILRELAGNVRSIVHGGM